jgi:excisionase family DNA binding protein
MKMGNDTEVLIAKEAALFLKAHVETIRQLARGGGIAAFKIGKDWRCYKGQMRCGSVVQNLKPSGGG